MRPNRSYAPAPASAQQSPQTLVSRPAFWVCILLFNIAFIGWLYSAVHTKVDYEAFYSAGNVFFEQPTHVYDPVHQVRSSRIWKSESDLLPFYHLPVELILFGPLSKLPYGWSLLVWRALCCGALLASAYLMARSLGLSFRNTALGYFAFVPALLCIGEGQDSTLLLFLLVLTFFLLRSDHQQFAGVVLAFGLFKPQVVGIVAIALLLARKRKFFLSFVVSSAAILALYTAYLGPHWIRDLIALVRWQEARETPPIMVSLHGLLSGVMQRGENAAAIVLSIVLLLGAALVWSRHKNLQLIFGSAVLIGSLMAFHFHVYDVTVYLLPITILMKAGETEWDRYALVAYYTSPLVIFLMAHLLTSWLALGAIVFLYSYWRIATEAKESHLAL